MRNSGYFLLVSRWVLDKRQLSQIPKVSRSLRAFQQGKLYELLVELGL